MATDENLVKTKSLKEIDSDYGRFEIAATRITGNKRTNDKVLVRLIKDGTVVLYDKWEVGAKEELQKLLKQKLGITFHFMRHGDYHLFSEMTYPNLSPETELSPAVKELETYKTKVNNDIVKLATFLVAENISENALQIIADRNKTKGED